MVSSNLVINHFIRADPKDVSVVSYAIKKKKFNPCDTDYLETALLVHKPFDKTRGTERKTKTGGGFIIYAFLLFKQPHILQYIKRVIDSGARTISSICSKLSCFLSENNVSGDIDRVHPFVHLHSISPPVVSSLFFSIPLPVLMQSAPRHSLPVTSTRERTQGKRSTARRQGVKTLIDHLFRTFSPSLFFFFFTVRTPPLHPSSHDNASIFVLRAVLDIHPMRPEARWKTEMNSGVCEPRSKVRMKCNVQDRLQDRLFRML